MSDCTEQSHQPLLSYWMSPQPHWGSPEKCVCVCEEYNHSPLDTLKTQPDVTSLNHRETCVYTCVGFWECVWECRSTSFCQVSLGETDCAHSWGKLGQVCVCACMYILMCPPSFLSLFVYFSLWIHPQSWSHMTLPVGVHSESTQILITINPLW